MLQLTNSEMKTWRRCQRKWKWEYYDGWIKRAQEPAGTPLAIGSRVHSALSAHYAGGDAVAALDAGVAEDLEKHPLYERQIRGDADLCHAMVSGYVDWLAETGVDAGLVVVAPETRVEVPLIDGVTLLAKLDARVQRESGYIGPAGPGARLALEFKTVGNLVSPIHTLQIDTQLLTEHLVEFLALKDAGQDSGRAQGVLYRMLRKVKRTASAKPPFFAEEEVPHSVDELRNHWMHVVAYAQDILAARSRLDAGESYHSVTPPSPQESCSWYCPLLQACKLATAEADVDGYLSEHFEIRDPLERYEGIEQVDE